MALVIDVLLYPQIIGLYSLYTLQRGIFAVDNKGEERSLTVMGITAVIKYAYSTMEDY
ncbi:hypothetical protein [Pyrobaculum aerophilum]|uniref:hypothetical protein n=1 Tax=Pyrobaculum aerophilum TaxID=13773 RepID=UPI0015F24CC9|nr:hypothetical protein [Pyrobaculum aerophilum]